MWALPSLQKFPNTFEISPLPYQHSIPERSVLGNTYVVGYRNSAPIRFRFWGVPPGIVYYHDSKVCSFRRWRSTHRAHCSTEGCHEPHYVVKSGISRYNNAHWFPRVSGNPSMASAARNLSTFFTRPLFLIGIRRVPAWVSYYLCDI